MSHIAANKEFWWEFIQLYWSLPELRKLKSDVYNNRNLRDAGYDELVEKLQEIKDADRDMVQKKINGLRTAYSWELKKITDSMKSGTFGHVFVMTIVKRLSLCKLTMWCMDTVSCCTTHSCSNLFDHVWGP
jgi:hypothetical protein